MADDDNGLTPKRKVLCVHARREIPARTQFGPLQGEPMEEKDVPEDMDMAELWQVYKLEDRVFKTNFTLILYRSFH